MTARSSLRIARIAAIAIAALFLLAALPVFADAGMIAEPTDDALTAALLRAVTEGHWWAAIAAAGALTIGILRRHGLIRVRWLAAVASIALAVAGGMLHHWIAGAGAWGPELLPTAIQIAVPMVLALVVPPRTTEPPALTERS